jgi:hypothetical protein
VSERAAMYHELRKRGTNGARASSNDRRREPSFPAGLYFTVNLSNRRSRLSLLKSLEEPLNVVEMALLDVPAGLQQIAENRRAHTTTPAQVGQILHAR